MINSHIVRHTTTVALISRGGSAKGAVVVRTSDLSAGRPISIKLVAEVAG